MRCDLHVHSRHSGSANVPLLPGWLECYSEPEAVYDTARRRGMDIVTLTDHDSVTGALLLRERRPDTFVSEEVTVLLGRRPRAALRRLRHRRAPARGDHAAPDRRRAPGGVPRRERHPVRGQPPVLAAHRTARHRRPRLGAVDRITPRDRQRDAARDLERARRRRAPPHPRRCRRRQRLARAALRRPLLHRGARRPLHNRVPRRFESRQVPCRRHGLERHRPHPRRSRRGAGRRAQRHPLGSRRARKALLATALLASAPLWVPAIGAAVGWSRLREHTMPRVYALGMARAAQRRRLGIA